MQAAIGDKRGNMEWPMEWEDLFEDKTRKQIFAVDILRHAIIHEMSSAERLAV